MEPTSSAPAPTSQAQSTQSNTHSAISWPQVVALAVVPLTVAIVGGLVTYSVGTRSTEVRLLELSITILQATPNDSTRALRKWAAETINRYSAIPLPPAVDTLTVPGGARRKASWSFSLPPDSTGKPRALVCYDEDAIPMKCEVKYMSGWAGIGVS